jgi:hypothetical protein
VKRKIDFVIVVVTVVIVVAHSYCVDRYKFCERVQLDSITQNELLDPDAALRGVKHNSPVADVTIPHQQPANNE